MKKLFKLHSIVLLIGLTIAGQSVMAQGNKSVFVEFFGNGLGISANFDCRFSKKENGLGFRAGIGYMPPTFFSNGFATFPIGINHLLGKGPHYLESGIGVTIIPGVTVFGDNEFRTSGIIYMPSLGYRYARNVKGFQGRIFASPMVAEGEFQFFYGLSGGFKF